MDVNIDNNNGKRALALATAAAVRSTRCAYLVTHRSNCLSVSGKVPLGPVGRRVAQNTQPHNCTIARSHTQVHDVTQPGSARGHAGVVHVHAVHCFKARQRELVHTGGRDLRELVHTDGRDLRECFRGGSGAMWGDI